jgi:hypothetical protein
MYDKDQGIIKAFSGHGHTTASKARYGSYRRCIGWFFFEAASGCLSFYMSLLVLSCIGGR